MSATTASHVYFVHPWITRMISSGPAAAQRGTAQQSRPDQGKSNSVRTGATSFAPPSWAIASYCQVSRTVRNLSSCARVRRNTTPASACSLHQDRLRWTGPQTFFPPRALLAPHPPATMVHYRGPIRARTAGLAPSSGGRATRSASRPPPPGVRMRTCVRT